MIQSKYRTKTTEMLNGVQHLYQFPNGYGASVIRHEGSYGYAQGLWELAVLGPEGELCYSTSIASDVIGRLTEQEIMLKLNEIMQLNCN